MDHVIHIDDLQARFQPCGPPNLYYMERTVSSHLSLFSQGWQIRASVVSPCRTTSFEARRLILPYQGLLTAYP